MTPSLREYMREIGRRGGKARMAKLSQAQKRRLARKAARARGRKRQDRKQEKQ
jgi:hypothetical protein